MKGRWTQIKYLFKEYWNKRQIKNDLILAPETGISQHDLKGKLHMAIYDLLKIEDM
jgi:hypothetical protein